MSGFAKVPKIIFLVPYRNREKQYHFFKEHMKLLLEDVDPGDYKILYCHQADSRPFNRGAMKNIGFLAVKANYPNDYKNITLVMNDVDTIPRTKNLFDYSTTRGIVKHFYGFKFALGGIVSITAGDFEMINGFPNFWAWGYEDNVLQNRATNARLLTDRSHFFPIGDNAIIYDLDGPIREVNSGEFRRFLQKTPEGIRSISDLDYTINEDTGFIDIAKFSTGQTPDMTKYKNYDLTNGPAPFDTKFGLMHNNRTRHKGCRFNMVL